MFTKWIFAAGCVAVLGAISVGRAVMLQPTDPQSHDVFLYQGTTAINYNGPGGFGAYLGTANSNGGGHDTESLLRFDVTGQSIPAGGKAFLGLYVTVSPGLPSVDPSASLTDVTDIFAVGSGDSFDETTATWGNTRTLAGNVGSPIAQATIGATGRYYEFDITAAVAGWIADASTNHGMLVRADAPFANGLGGVFYESAAGDNRPYISIVPEPASLFALALPALLIARRRR